MYTGGCADGQRVIASKYVSHAGLAFTASFASTLDRQVLSCSENSKPDRRVLPLTDLIAARLSRLMMSLSTLSSIEPERQRFDGRHM